MRLPGWCASVASLGSIWLDLWLSLDVPPSASAPLVLLTALSPAGSPVLRWYLEAAPEAGAGGWLAGLSVVSMVGVKTVVKKWGPLGGRALVGGWHHLALTLRFARVSNQVRAPKCRYLFTRLDSKPSIQAILLDSEGTSP